MEIITSNSNDKVKFVRKLKEKKHRTESGLTIVEGGNLLKDMPDFAIVKTLVFTPDRRDEFEDVIRRFESAEVLIVSESVMQTLSDTESPYGALAVVKIPKTESSFSKSRAEALKKIQSENTLFVDGLSDSGNLGTILRTAAAVGFENICLFQSADVWAPKVIRASMGAVFHLNIFEIDEDTAVEALKNTNSYALDMGGENMFCTKIDKPVLLAVGSEAHGISDVVSSNVNRKLSLPMKKMESLNAAVAAGIAMYHIALFGESKF